MACEPTAEPEEDAVVARAEGVALVEGVVRVEEVARVEGVVRVWGWVGGWGGVGGVGVEEDTGVAACLTRAALAAVFFTVAFFLAAPIFGFPFTFFSMATILLYFPCRPQAPPSPCRPPCRSFAGRGLNPRPERSIHARAGEQMTENSSKDLLREYFSGFENAANIWRDGAFRLCAGRG